MINVDKSIEILEQQIINIRKEQEHLHQTVLELYAYKYKSKIIDLLTTLLTGNADTFEHVSGYSDEAWKYSGVRWENYEWEKAPFPHQVLDFLIKNDYIWDHFNWHGDDELNYSHYELTSKGKQYLENLLNEKN